MFKVVIDRTVKFLSAPVRKFIRRRRLEKELAATREFLEKIMESSVDGIVTTDLRGKVTYINRAMGELIQYKREEIIGRHIAEVYSRGIEQARDIMELLQKNDQATNYEMEVKRRNGEKRIILNSLFLVRDAENEVIGTAGIFKDITEQKQLEAKLKTAQMHLLEVSKLRALGELVAGVAHELNNPLMASQTMLHLLLKNLRQDFPERERLVFIGQCNDRIERIVNHLLEFSRQTKPEFKQIDINLPIENALLISARQLADHGITLRQQLNSDLPKVKADAGQLEQVFLNLIFNARDAMDETVKVRELLIASAYEAEPGPSVVVSIKDTGTGIVPEILNKVFEPFFTTKPAGKGTGLGLS
ncbi:MAG: PAS domain S-box protein, partial [Desulfobacteraceae bacterium]